MAKYILNPPVISFTIKVIPVAPVVGVFINVTVTAARELYIPVSRLIMLSPFDKTPSYWANLSFNATSWDGKAVAKTWQKRGKGHHKKTRR